MSSQTAVLTLLGTKASQELKNLLENKHLYQSVNIGPAEILKQQIDQERQANLKQALFAWSSQELPKMRFALAQQQLSVVARGASQAAPALTLVLHHPSLFCRNCERREAFAPIWYTDVSNEIRQAIASGVSKQVSLPDGFQHFFLVYQCQRCLGKPESFLVRREGWILGLHGRSPIELVEVPAYVPKPESWFYRDAVIAFNSGKILAALFYLRTFVEQFARRVTGLKGKITGDEIFDEYYKTLPAPMKDEMPSLREWYEKLSEALHSARADAPLFETAKTEIEKHFDIRRVFKMQEGKSTAEDKPAEAAAGKPAGAASEAQSS